MVDVENRGHRLIGCCLQHGNQRKVMNLKVSTMTSTLRDSFSTRSGYDVIHQLSCYIGTKILANHTHYDGLGEGISLRTVGCLYQ